MECPECGCSEWLLPGVAKTFTFLVFLFWLIPIRRGFVGVCGNCGHSVRIRRDGIKPTRAIASGVKPPSASAKERPEPLMRDRDQRRKWSRSGSE